MKHKTVIIGAILMLITSSALWGQRNNTPEARLGHSMVRLPDGRVMLFGGENVEGDLFNDMHAFDESGWNQVTPANDPPPARQGHCAWVEDVMYIYGGQGETGLLDDIWSFDPVTETWTQLPSGGASTPVARENASMVGYGDDLYVYGGTDATGSNLMDFWSYNRTSSNWTQKEDHAPSAGQSAALHNNDMYVYGGVRWNDNDYRNDVRRYSLPNDNEFHYVYTSGDAPGGCAYHAVASDVEKMWVAGGMNADKAILDDFYEFNMSTETWTQLPDCPIARAYSAMAYVEDDSKIILFGGLDPYGNATNDLCIYDLSTNTWLLVGIDEPEGILPLGFTISAYPNPFSSGVTIKYQLAVYKQWELPANIKIYNVKGSLVRTLQITYYHLPITNIVWDGKDINGIEVQSGIYFLTIKGYKPVKVVKLR
ncbi:hypothetical protein KAW65_09415 [candidate division WOR-3 bacterium]|nr:hypothetical protein [candidate division WOR-3 bacterium]